MNWLDIVILGIIALSFFSGLFKGIVREVFSLGGVVLGIVAGMLFAGPVGAGLERWIPSEAASYAAAMLLVFLAVMIGVEFVARLVQRVIKMVKLGAVNHLLGGAFGLVRGILIGTVLVLGIALFLEPGHPALAESRLTPFLSWTAEGLAGLLPEDVRAVFDEQLERLQELAEDAKGAVEI